MSLVTLSSHILSHPDLEMPAPQDKAAATAAEKPVTAAVVAKDQPQDPLKQVQALVEKKIRNLEKRKVRTEATEPALTLLSHLIPGHRVNWKSFGRD